MARAEQRLEFDPMERAYGYRRHKEQRRRRSRERVRRNEAAYLSEDPELFTPVDATLIETVDELPEEDEDFLGQQFIVATDDEDEEPRTVELAQLPDGTLQWRDVRNPRGGWPAQFSSSFGGVGLTDGLFGDGTLRGVVASAITTDVYTASDDRVQRFSANGTFETVLATAGTGNGEVDTPVGLSLYSGIGFDAVVIADAGNDQIKSINGQTGSAFTPFGSAGTGDGQFDSPNGVMSQNRTFPGALDIARYYVADTGNNRIQIFDGGGNYEAQWGSLGSAAGEFNAPVGIAGDPQLRVWVVDSGNHRVQVFTNGSVAQGTGGAFLFALGGLGAANGRFNTPHSVAIDALGNAWVTDSGNHRVQVFSPQGIFLGTFGEFGTGDGQFDSPNGIAIADDFVYVCDSGNNRVCIFTNPTARETRYPVIVGSNSTTWATGNIPGGQQVNTTLSVPGALTSDDVRVSHTGARTFASAPVLEAWVESADTVRVIAWNHASSTASIGNGTLRVTVMRDPA